MLNVKLYTELRCCAAFGHQTETQQLGAMGYAQRFSGASGPRLAYSMREVPTAMERVAVAVSVQLRRSDHKAACYSTVFFVRVAISTK